MTVEDLGSWLKEKRLDAGINRPDLSRAIKKIFDIDVSKEYIVKIESNERPLSKVNLAIREAIRQALKISPEEWQQATGLLVPASEESAPSIPRTFLHPIRPLELAGKELSPQELGMLPLQPVSPENFKDGMHVYRASDSMQTQDPASIHEGDLIFVDSQDTEPREGKIYVAKGAKAPGIYRVRRMDGELMLAPDNPVLRQIPVTEARIIGRVYSSLRITRH